MLINLNGQLVPENEAKISVFDHGLLYGDGVFEGIRTYHGRIFMLEEHIKRLYRSARAIALDLSMSPVEMAQRVIATCAANDTCDGYVRLIVTRGIGTLGLNPYLCSEPQIIVIAADIQLYPKELYEEGMAVITAGTVRNHCEAVNPCIKSLNYLNNILAKIEAINADVMEAIMLNSQGYVAEATGDNIFIVRGNELLTPPTHAGALEGITRRVVMQLAGETHGMTVRESMLTRYDLYTADEVFLTGTAAEVIGVIDVDKRRIGNGRPGPWTCRLAESYHALAATTGTPISS